MPNPYWTHHVISNEMIVGKALLAFHARCPAFQLIVNLLFIYEYCKYNVYQLRYPPDWLQISIPLVDYISTTNASEGIRFKGVLISFLREVQRTSQTSLHTLSWHSMRKKWQDEKTAIAGRWYLPEPPMAGLSEQLFALRAENISDNWVSCRILNATGLLLDSASHSSRHTCTPSIDLK